MIILNNEFVKRISFDDYVNKFYDLIKINKPSNTLSNPSGNEGGLKSLIFFKQQDNNVITITFNFLNFLITCDVCTNSLMETYNLKYYDTETKPEFIEWFDNTYLDNRGIEEI